MKWQNKAWCSRYLPTGEMVVMRGVSNEIRKQALKVLISRLENYHIPMDSLRTELIDYEPCLAEYLVEPTEEAPNA